MQKCFDKTLLRTILTLILSCLLALSMAGCGGGGGGTPSPTPTATTLNTTLTGAQEIPANASTATGTATVTIDAARTTITVNLTTTGLANVTAAHIHVGRPGANGGIIFSLFNAATDGAFTGTINKTLTSADLSVKPLEGVATFADAVNAILSGNAYINVHTQAIPGGEIRGQLGPVSITTSLTGAKEIPANASTATGTATVTIDAARTTITVNLTTAGLTNVTASHIHVGAPGANGGIIFSLFNAATDGAFTGAINKTLTSADLSAKPLEGVATFADAVNAILSGNAYINVHTQAIPGGEIRGQLTPQ